MKIAAITRFKHGALWQALKKLGWSQSELARRCNFNASRMGRIINLLERPTQKLADTIQKVLAEEGIYIDPITEWPETFRGLPIRVCIEQTREVDVLELEAAQVFYDQLADRQQNDWASDVIRPLLGALNDRERSVIDQRFGLAGEPKTAEQLARKYGVRRQQIYNIEAKALRKLQRQARRAQR